MSRRSDFCRQNRAKVNERGVVHRGRDQIDGPGEVGNRTETSGRRFGLYFCFHSLSRKPRGGNLEMDHFVLRCL